MFLQEWFRWKPVPEESEKQEKPEKQEKQEKELVKKNKKTKAYRGSTTASFLIDRKGTNYKKTRKRR